MTGLHQPTLSLSIKKRFAQISDSLTDSLME